jgi:hypothetical protein
MRLDPAPRSKARQEPQAHDALVASAVRGRQEELLRARSFARVDDANHFVFLGCASVGEYGLRIGYGSRQAREYAAAGRVIERHPPAAGMLLAGEVCISTLAIIEPWFVREDLPLPEALGDVAATEGTERFGAVLSWARLLPDRELRRILERCKAKGQSGADPVQRTLQLTRQGAADLDRTQVLVSRREKRAVSASEAAARAFRFFVEKHDILEKPPRGRRLPPMPPTQDGSKNPRSVPAEVLRALMAKYDDVCAIGLCDHRIWLENAHHLSHALGGGNEIQHQDRICSGHHAMKDHGEIRWVKDPGAIGGGYYLTREGKIRSLKPPKTGSPGVEPPSDGADRVRERGARMQASRRPVDRGHVPGLVPRHVPRHVPGFLPRLVPRHVPRHVPRRVGRTPRSVGPDARTRAARTT